MATYRIYELSARAVMSYAAEKDGVYTFALNRSATEHCKVPGAKHEQDSCAMFHQLMYELQGKGWRERGEEKVTALSDVLFYMDFAGIFDRRGTGRTQQARREKARDMFRPEGITLDFGSGPHRYVAFERSASMSRQSRLSFIRADLYEPIRQRIMLNMELDRCQLSKLYAYNGLMFSSGTRVDGIRIDKKHRVIVIDNPSKRVERAPVITLREGEEPGSFYRVDTLETLDITCFDGVGLISKEYAQVVDKACCGSHIHTSFQIRMPYIKGMLHQVDFKDFLKRSGTQSIVDIWGKAHPVRSVDIILTRSQFKAYGWLRENGMTWEDYWDAFRDYNHALYITNLSKTEPEELVELNYQFLSTLSIQPEEFRPADLPEGWGHSPADDPRQWLTKATETAYFNFRANETYQQEYFRRGLSHPKGSRANIMARVLEKNPKFIREPIYTEQLDGQARKILRGYAVGRLLVPGDNRFLSGDLLELLRQLIAPRVFQLPGERDFCNQVMGDFFAEDSFFAPGAAYDHEDSCTLLRNPHIARNEELQLSVYPEGDELRQHYLGHLTDVVMVSADSLAAERLGGADYDGDLIKTIADPILNRCVKRNYDYDVHQQLSNNANLPLLKIPSLSAPKSDANDWQARFQTVENTFAARIGQICNAALDRSVIAYNDHADPEERKRCRRDLEALAIYSGLEIDAAKTGVRPNLDEFLGGRRVRHITVLEEAHNILGANPSSANAEGTNISEKSVEMISNAIAEMRTYGEGFVIADQSPGAVDISAIRNTNTKIIMRLPEENDRRIAGKSAALKDIQIDEIARLPQGVAVVYQNDWIEPVLCKIDKYEGAEADFCEPSTDEELDKTKRAASVLIQFVAHGRLDDPKEIVPAEIGDAIDSSDCIVRVKAALISLLREYKVKGTLRIWDDSFFGEQAQLVKGILGLEDAVEIARKTSLNIEGFSCRLNTLIAQKMSGVTDDMLLTLSHYLVKAYSLSDNEGVEFYQRWVEEIKERGRLA